MRHYTPNRQQRNNQHRGVAVVELAVCLPVLMLIVIATIESSAMIFLQQSLSITAYEGARVSLSPGATAQDVADQCDLLMQSREIKKGTVRVTPLNLASVPAGDWISVEVNAPFGDNSLMGGWLFSEKLITSNVQMMKERGAN